MNDTPRTEKAFNNAAVLSTFAHQRRYLMAQMESMERENAKLRDQNAGLEAACDSLQQTVHALQNSTHHEPNHPH